MSNITTAELKDRVEAYRHELMAKLATLKADTRHEATATRDKLQKGLKDLEETIKDGWDNMTAAAREKLNRLIEKD
jgi:DNA anti-recombination protein RmuC